MLTPAPPQQRFLERVRHWLVALKRLVGAADWDPQLAGQVERGLLVILDFARNRRLDEVAEAVQHLHQDWIRLLPPGLAPGAAVRDALRVQAQRVFKAIAAASAGDRAQAGLPVYALLPERIPGALVLQAFQTQGLHLSVFHEGDALARALAERRPEALIVETALAAALAELLDRLSPSLPGIGQLPIAAFASAEDPHPRLHAALAGADLYAEAIEDPLLASRLRHLLAEHIRDPYRVLIVDDDVSTGLLSQAILQRAGFEVELAGDADSARDALARRLPDLVLMDLELPGESGLALTACFRDARGALVLPIVFLSGADGEDARFDALRAGGDDFLVKPVRPRHLISMARSRIKRARTLARQLRARATTARGHLRRGAFLEQLRKALLMPSEEPMWLFLMRIDHEQALRQRLGVVRSNELEHAVVDRIHALLDDADVYCLLDEFELALLIERPAGSDPIGLANELVRAVREQDFHDAGERVSLTASVGIARRPQTTTDLEAWLQMGLGALRSAQDLGGDRVEGYPGTSGPPPVAERQIRLRALLTTATAADWRMDFRPLLPLHSEQVHRYLAGVQLRDGSRAGEGFGREEWLDTAQALGLVEALDRHAAAHAVDTLGDYARHGQILDLSLPVEPASLAHLRQALASLPHAASGVRLILELDAERALEQALLLKRFVNLRLAGVALGLIDRSGRFGHWPAMLALPVERLRVPAGALIEARSAAAAMTQRWRAAGRSLTAEAVDQPAMLSVLWSLGVDHVAGDAIAPSGQRPDFDFAAFLH